MPGKPIRADFYESLPTGQYLIVQINKYSRYSEAEIINRTSGRTLTTKLDAIFARQGIPHTFKSDNGPTLMVMTLKLTRQNWVSNAKHRRKIGHRATRKPKDS